MATTTTTTNKPLNPRAQDLSPKGYNRANIFSGKALDFDGVNDILTTGAVSATLNSFTITGYMKFDALGTDLIAISLASVNSNNERFIIFNNAADGEKLHIYAPLINVSASYSSNYTIKAGEWFHYAITFGTSMTFYINGRQTATHAVTNSTALSNDFILGARKFVSYSQYFNGDHAGFKAFGVTLTPAQVSDLYLNPEKIVPDGVASSALKLWLPMMEGAGTTAYDGSGNGNDGTINGATWTAGIGAPVAQTALVSWNKGSNLSTYSEQFDNAAWTKQDSTITANSTTSPDGNQNADELKVNTSTSFHQMTSAQVVSIGTTYAFSVYAKQGSGTKYLQFAGAGLQAASQAPIFDLQNGIAYTAATKTVCLSANIENVGNGWYRCSAIVSATGTAGFTICFTQTTNAFSGDSFAGNGTDSFYIWGAQVTQGTNLGPYIKTNATAQTSAVLVPEGLTAGASIFGTNIITPRNAFALNLDGVSWAEVHDNASLDFGSSSWTMECWVYWDGISNGDGIMSRWYSSERAMLFYTQGTFIRLFTGRTGGTADTDISSSTISVGWRHIVGTYDSSDTKLRIYIDGALNVTSSAFANAYNSNAQSLEIGRLNNDANGTYTNQIALPRIYNRALTATEVLRNYNADKSKFGL